MTLYRRILRYLRPHGGLFGVAVVAMAVYGFLDAFSFALLIPFFDVLFGEGALASAGGGFVHRLLEWTVGDAVAAAPMVGLRNVVIAIFIVYLLKNVARYVESYTVIVIEERVSRDLRDEIYAHLLEMDFPFFQRTRAGQIISRVTNDVDRVRKLVTRNLAQVLSNTIQAVIMFAMMLSLSWRLTLVTLVAIPLMVGLWNRFRRRLRLGVLKVLDAVGELSSHIQETISGIMLVKSVGAEPYEARRFRRLTRQHYKAVIRNERWRQFFPPATEMITSLAISILLIYGGWLVLGEGSLRPAAFLAFAAIAMRLLSPVKWLGQFPALVQPGLAAAERAFELLDAVPEIRHGGDRGVESLEESVRLERVGFQYSPGEPVLEDVDLELRRGEVVALVGPSGAGKTTLAQLLPRFYDPTEGRILLDGIDLREYRLRDLRGLMAIVSQETVIFHDTVRSNIAYGRPEGTPGEIEEAARAANAADFIEELPDGYDTVLGERGTRLSGGQRQRIAIARALLRNAPILILDEATSALDTRSERLVQHAIDRLMEDRTALVIAHRLSTVHRADQIIVLDGGRIVERGRHQELLDRNGLYRRLYRMQFGAAEEAGFGPAVGTA